MQIDANLPSRQYLGYETALLALARHRAAPGTAGQGIEGYGKMIAVIQSEQNPALASPSGYPMHKPSSEQSRRLYPQPIAPHAPGFERVCRTHLERKSAMTSSAMARNIINALVAVLSVAALMAMPALASAEAFFLDSNATGFFISQQGHLVTAYHAVENRKVAVVLPDGRAVSADLVKHNKEADLALLKISETTPFLPIARPENIDIGLEIMTIGYPMMTVQGRSAKASRGIINSLVGFHEDKSSFQFDAATARGNSGGPVIGPGGMVVGVVNGKLHTTKVLERTKEWIVNVNYATNVTTLLQFLDGVDGLPAPKPLMADTALNVRKLAAETRGAIVPVVSDMSAMKPAPSKISD